MTTTPNAELAYQVLDHIDAHPEQWWQGLYIGRINGVTVACLGGRAALLSGAEPIYSDDTCNRTGVVRVGDRTRDVSDYSKEILGVAYLDGDYLFNAYNTRTDLGQLVERVFGPRPGGAA